MTSTGELSDSIFEVELPGGRAAFSTRHGGVSTGPFESLNLAVRTGDLDERVAENRRRLADGLGLGHERVATLWQVQGADLYEWLKPLGPPGWATIGRKLHHADGHLTAIPGIGLSVQVADCLPVALISPGRVAMLHCGRRPLAAGIVERALERFQERPAAAIGPGIGRCCYGDGPPGRDRVADLSPASGLTHLIGADGRKRAARR